MGKIVMDLKTAKEDFMDVWENRLSGEDREDFRSFVESQILSGIEADDNERKTKKNVCSVGKAKKIVQMEKIKRLIKAKLPTVDAMAPGERTFIPENESFQGYTTENTINIDGFLYNDNDVDDMCDSGAFPRSICTACNSTDVVDMNYISHSMSDEQLKILFGTWLKLDKSQTDSSQIKLMDVGSRLGAVLYGAFYYSNIENITGVEINPFFCSLQKDIIQKFNLGDRVIVVEGDILDQKTLVSTSDIVVLNNVFQFFVEECEMQKNIWNFLREHVKKGALLVTSPSIPELLQSCQCSFEADKWVEEIMRGEPPVEGKDEEEIDPMEGVFLYRVL
eukprot:Nk52_evm25s279 gene=Nk52_evmTU25s279